MNRTERARRTLDRLREAIPRPETELQYRTEFELLVAVILSAQCTDARVNLVTPDLFAAYPTPAAMAEAEADEIFPFIRSVSYPNNKATALASTARMLVEDVRRRGAAHAQGVDDAARRRAEDGERDRRRGLRRAGDRRRHARLSRGEPDRARGRCADAACRRRRPPPRDPARGLGRGAPPPHPARPLHLHAPAARSARPARSPTSADYFAKLQKLPAPLSGLDPKKGRYFCKTNGRYFDEPATKIDRYGVEQIADPVSGSMNVFRTKTGETTKQDQGLPHRLRRHVDQCFVWRRVGWHRPHAMSS